MRFVLVTIAYCVAAFAGGSSLGADPRGAVAQQLLAAQAHFQQGKYASAYQAARDCNAAVGQNPYAGAVLLLTKICGRSGRLDEALQYGRQYLSIVDRPELRDEPAMQSSRQEIATLLGDTCQQLGRPDEARRWYQHALDIPGGQRTHRPAWQFEVQLAAAKLQADAPPGQENSPALQRQCEAIAQQIESLLNAPAGREAMAKDRDELTYVLADALIAAGKRLDARQWLERLLPSQSAPAERVATYTRLADLARQMPDPPQQVRQLVLAIEQQRLCTGADAKLDLIRLVSQLADALDQAATGDPKRAGQLRDQARQHRAQVARWCAEVRDEVKSADADPLRQLTVQQQLVEVARDAANWPQARDSAAELLRLRRQILLSDDPSIYRTMTALGTYLAKCREFGQARTQLQEAVEYWRRREPRADQDLGDTLQNLGEVTREEGDYAESRDYFQQALQAFDRTGSNLVQRLEGRVGLANVLAAEGRYHQAIEQFADAERLARQAPAGGDEDTRRLLSRALLGRAIVYRMHLAQLQLAIDDCEEALTLFRATASSAPLDEVPYLATRATLYLAQYEADGCPAESADLQTAKESIEQAYGLTSSQEVEASAERCQVLHVLGVIRLREAQTHFREGGDGDPQAAVVACDEAVQRWRQAEKIGTIAGQARSLCYLAEAYLFAFDRGLPLGRQAPQVVLSEALALASQAAQRLQTMQVYPGLYYRALLVRAKVLRRQARQLRGAQQEALAAEKMDLAIADLKNAARQVEAPRFASLGSDAERAEFFSQFVEAYELLVACLAHVGRFDEALAYSQISRNRTFIEQVLISQEDLRAELEPLGKSSLLDELAEAALKRDRLKAESLRALDRPNPGDKRAPLLQSLADAQRHYDRLSGEIRRQSSSYRNLLDGGLSPDDWSRARKQILRRNEAMLVYHLGDAGSYLFFVRADAQAAVEAFPLWITAEIAQTLGVAPGPLNNATARSLVRHYLWRRGTANSRGSGAALVAPPQPLSAEQALLFCELLLPSQVRDAVRQSKPSALIVVPDGALHELPLESLLLRSESGAPKYLLDDETMPPLCYAPSAMVLAALETRAQPMPRAPRVLSVGNPDNTAMQPLLKAAAECDAWRQRFADASGENVTTLLGTQATTTNVLTQVAHQHLLHFAVHGLVDRRFDDVFAASLLLTPARDGKDRLNLQDVYRMPLADCHLAVLSACQSNVGAARKLEAGATLTRAFLSAGAERVVSSLWQVDDEATLALMREFAEAIGSALAQGAPPNYAHALQQARRRVKQAPGGAWQDPYFWAPFVLVGPAE